MVFLLHVCVFCINCQWLSVGILEVNATKKTA